MDAPGPGSRHKSDLGLGIRPPPAAGKEDERHQHAKHFLFGHRVRSKSAGHRGDDNEQGGTEEQRVKACDESHVLKSFALEPGMRCSRQADRQERQTDDHSDKADDPQGLR
jgi:hypothetical protein